MVSKSPFSVVRPLSSAGGINMLSRTADNLYWLARYVERAEFLARVL